MARSPSDEAVPSSLSPLQPDPVGDWAAAAWRALPDLCFVLDGEHRLVDINRPDHEALATPWAALQGRTLGEVMPAAMVRRWGAALARARDLGRPESLEYRLRLAGHAPCSFEARIVALARGHWLVVTRDITVAVAAQQALRESEARYARAMRGTSDGLWDWEVATGRDYLSPRWKELLGFAPHELDDAEDSFFGRLHADDAGTVRAAVHAHFQHGAPFDLELRLLTKDGSYRWFRSRGEAERDALGRPVRMAGSIADITARKQIEQALQDSQAKFSAMFHTAPVGMSLSALDDSCLLEVNEELAQMLGWRVGEMVGRSAVELGIWADAGQREAAVAQVRQAGRAALHDLPMRHRDGRRLHVRLSMQRLELNGHTLLLKAATDITDRVVAEAQGLRLQSELSALTRKLLSHEQRTTQRLAQALHDQLGQTLTALRITLDHDRRASDSLPADADRRRAQAEELVAQAIQQVRRVLVDLRPPLLEDEGLYAALDNDIATRATLHPQTDVLLDVPEGLQTQRWPADVEYALFMIAREALDNALRHADATLVTVSMGGDAGCAQVEVADNGAGMAPGADRVRPGHLGLVGMRERARAIGAQLRIEPGADGGTSLTVRWSAAP